LTIKATTFTYCSSFGNVLAFLGTMLLMYLCHKPSIAWSSSLMVIHRMCVEFEACVAQNFWDWIGLDCSSRIIHKIYSTTRNSKLGSMRPVLEFAMRHTYYRSECKVLIADLYTLLYTTCPVHICAPNINFSVFTQIIPSGCDQHSCHFIWLLPLQELGTDLPF